MLASTKEQAYTRWYDFTECTSNTLLDSYGNLNVNDTDTLDSTIPRMGQSFTTPNDGISYNLNSCRFHTYNVGGTATGTVYAELYSHSGVYGTSSVPNASLATSTVVDIATIPDEPGFFTFSFDGNYAMSVNTNYVIVIRSDDVTGSIEVGDDTVSTTHGGNSARFIAAAWVADSTSDLAFVLCGSSAATGRFLCLLGAGI